MFIWMEHFFVFRSFPCPVRTGLKTQLRWCVAFSGRNVMPPVRLSISPSPSYFLYPIITPHTDYKAHMLSVSIFVVWYILRNALWDSTSKPKPGCSSAALEIDLSPQTKCLVALNMQCYTGDCTTAPAVTHRIISAKFSIRVCWEASKPGHLAPCVALNS